MPIVFAGTFTPADLQRALAIRRTALPNPNRIIFGVTAFTFVVLLIVGVVLNPARLWAVLIFVALFLLLQWVSGRLSALLTHEEWAGATNLHEPQSGTADEAGIEVRFQYGSSRYQWGSYYYQVITPDMILLFLGATTFHFYPRSFFADDAAWQAFGALVQQHVPAQPPAAWRPAYARLNALWVTLVFMTLFISLVVVFSI